jgi:hypothetical protein
MAAATSAKSSKSKGITRTVTWSASESSSGRRSWDRAAARSPTLMLSAASWTSATQGMGCGPSITTRRSIRWRTRISLSSAGSSGTRRGKRARAGVVSSHASLSLFTDPSGPRLDPADLDRVHSEQGRRLPRAQSCRVTQPAKFDRQTQPLRVRCSAAGELRIGAWDADLSPPEPPRPFAPASYTANGRGLALVRACAGTSGWQPLTREGDRHIGAPRVSAEKPMPRGSPGRDLRQVCRTPPETRVLQRLPPQHPCELNT